MRSDAAAGKGRQGSSRCCTQVPVGVPGYEYVVSVFPVICNRQTNKSWRFQKEAASLGKAERRPLVLHWPHYRNNWSSEFKRMKEEDIRFRQPSSPRSRCHATQVFSPVLPALLPPLLWNPKGNKVLSFLSLPGIAIEPVASVEDVDSFPNSTQERERGKSRYGLMCITHETGLRITPFYHHWLLTSTWKSHVLQLSDMSVIA